VASSLQTKNNNKTTINSSGGASVIAAELRNQCGLIMAKNRNNLTYGGGIE